VTVHIGRSRFAVLHPARSGSDSPRDRRAIRIFNMLRIVALIGVIVIFVAAVV
jgi:hypothetical protein